MDSFGALNNDKDDKDLQATAGQDEANALSSWLSLMSLWSCRS